MDKHYDELPPSQSSVSLRLADIRKRCSELGEDSELGGLSLEDPITKPDDGNPYDRG